MATLEYLASEQYEAFWRDGFLVLKNLLNADTATRCRQAVLGLVPTDLSIPKHFQCKNGRIVPMPEDGQLNWFLPELIPLSQHEGLYSAVADLFGEKRLRVVEAATTVNIRTDGEPGPIQSIHIDAHLPEALDGHELRYGVGMGGLWYLSNVESGGAGIYVVPGGHNWVMQKYRELDEPRKFFSEPRSPDNPIDWPPAVEVTGEAGDFVLMHHLMPHCGARNTNERPRVVQFTRFALEDTKQPRPTLIPIDKMSKELSACITPLGRRLLGLEPWE